MANLEKANSNDHLPHVEKITADPNESNVVGLSSEDQHFLDTFDTKRAAHIYRKVRSRPIRLEETGAR